MKGIDEYGNGLKCIDIHVYKHTSYRVRYGFN